MRIVKIIFVYVRKCISNINLYIYHYQKFGSGGVYLLRKSKTRSDAILQFPVKGLQHPLYLRNNTSDIDVFYQVFGFKQYLLKKKIDPTVIIDCGAHVGYSAVYFASTFPNATVIAIEPDRQNFELLLKNTAYYQNVKCLNAGVWKHAAELETIEYAGRGWATKTKAAEVVKKSNVPGLGVSDILSKFELNKIDIIKIDIEGSEIELFEIGYYESWLNKTSILIIELHDRIRKGCSKSLFTAMSKFNFTLGNKGENLIFFMERNDNSE